MFSETTSVDNLKLITSSLESHIVKINKRIEKAPTGALRITKKWNKNQYYHRISPSDSQGTYIPEKDRPLAARLAQKDYDNKLLKVLEDQKRAIDRFLKDYDPDAAQRVYEELSEQRKKLVTPEFLSDEEFIRRFLSQPYKRPGFKSTDPLFYTDNGERVRSKSEILIANAMLRNKVPYLCEFPVYDSGIVIAAPDFKCLNVRLRKVFYWEHLGKLGDQGYADYNVNKFEKYSLAEDFDEARLILTFETDNHPLNTKVIEEKIRRFLL